MCVSPTDLENFAAFARRLAAAARAETLPRFRAGTAVANKGDGAFDPVTDADREAERAIAALIEETYPDHGIVGEEFGERPGAGAIRWIVDPVDGTRAFVCGQTSWATLIALEIEGAPALGLIDQPYTDECWLAAGGAGDFRRAGAARPLGVSGVQRLAEARIATTDPRLDGYMSAADIEGFARLSAACRVARFSMDAYAYGLLAIGQIDIVVETGLALHDYAALSPVVEAAGGVVSNWRGGPVGADGRGEMLAAASPALHAAALERLNG